MSVDSSRCREHDRKQSGQTLVIVALALIALLGFLALAIDVGVLYAWRRNMQNAADAAALAGAREICLGHTEAEAVAAIQEYALVENRAMTETHEIDGGLVTVYTGVDVNLFFARVLGVDQSGVTARAVAQCGPAEGGCATWPIALAVEARDNWLKEGDPCGEDAEEFILLDSDKTCGDCEDDTCFDCDADDDGTWDFKFGGGRGWLDFPDLPEEEYGSTCGGGANCLKYWIGNPYPGDLPKPCCIKQEPGTTASAFAETEDYVGLDVAVPVFDGLSDDGTCPNGDPIVGETSNDYYHIVDYVCIEVVSYEKNYEMLLGNGKTTKVNAIFVRKSCNDCFVCGSTAGGEFVPGGLSAVSLIE